MRQLLRDFTRRAKDAGADRVADGDRHAKADAKHAQQTAPRRVGRAGRDAGQNGSARFEIRVQQPVEQVFACFTANGEAAGRVGPRAKSALD